MKIENNPYAGYKPLDRTWEQGYKDGYEQGKRDCAAELAAGRERKLRGHLPEVPEQGECRMSGYYYCPSCGLEVTPNYDEYCTTCGTACVTVDECYTQEQANHAFELLKAEASFDVERVEQLQAQLAATEAERDYLAELLLAVTRKYETASKLIGKITALQLKAVAERDEAMGVIGACLTTLEKNKPMDRAERVGAAENVYQRLAVYSREGAKK